MKKLLLVVLMLVVSLFSVSAFAFTPPDKPGDGWYVLDQAGKLSSDQKSQLNHKIETLNKTTKNEYAVAILSTLDGGNIEDAAQATFRSWGVGKKGLNNGVLLMISVGDRKTRLQTGKGAEGDLPDLLCSDILANTLRPRLKAGKWYEGVDETIDAVAGHMESRNKEKTAAPKADDTKTDSISVTSTPKTTHSSGCSASPGPGPGSVLVLVLVGLGLVGFYLSRKASKAAAEAQRIRDQKRDQWEESLRSDQRVRDEQRAAALARERERELANARTFVAKPTVPTPVVLSSGLPRIPRPDGVPVTPTAKSSGLSTAQKVGLGVAGVAVAAGAAELASEALRRREEEASRRRREEEASARRRQDDEDTARRRRNEDSSPSYTPSFGGSSWDSGSSSSGGFDSGGSGFGGGDSGGGGSSGDF